MKLIKLQDKFILVSDEEIKEGDWYYTPIKRSIEQCVRKLLIIKGGENDREQLKIIAGIPELPTIDFSLLSEEDCKTIGWVDVEKLCEELYPYNNTIGFPKDSLIERIAFKRGFKTAQSLNDKKFSFNKEDLRNFAKIFFELYQTNDFDDEELIERFHSVFENNIKSLQQTVWNVGVEMEEVWFHGSGYYTKEQLSKEEQERYIFMKETRPKITNNSIKVTKIL